MLLGLVAGPCSARCLMGSVCQELFPSLSGPGGIAAVSGHGWASVLVEIHGVPAGTLTPDLAALNGHPAMEHISCCCQLGVCGRLGRNVLRQQDGARAVQPFVPLFCPAAMEPNILRQRFLTELHGEVRPIDLLAVESISGVHNVMGLTLPWIHTSTNEEQTQSGLHCAQSVTA